MRQANDARSSRPRARAVADAVLYEGYVLYPYRSTSSKNAIRWQWGVLMPEDAVDTRRLRESGEPHRRRAGRSRVVLARDGAVPAGAAAVRRGRHGRTGRTAGGGRHRVPPLGRGVRGRAGRRRRPGGVQGTHLRGAGWHGSRGRGQRSARARARAARLLTGRRGRAARVAVRRDAGVPAGPEPTGPPSRRRPTDRRGCADRWSPATCCSSSTKLLSSRSSTRRSGRRAMSRPARATASSPCSPGRPTRRRSC